MVSELIFGKNTVIEIVKSGYKVDELFITEQILHKDKEMMSIIKSTNIKYNVVDKKYLDNLTKGNHQGIAALIESFKYYEIDDVLHEAKSKNEKPFFIILDGLEDVHNLGAILRTADACGVHGVIIPKNRSVSLNATVAKLSSGAVMYVKVVKVTNITNTIKELKNNGIWVVGTDVSTDIDYRKMSGEEPIAIVIGNEGKGISRLVKENCDILVKLPMIGKISSLNASVAASIMMYEVMRARYPL